MKDLKIIKVNNSVYLGEVEENEKNTIIKNAILIGNDGGEWWDFFAKEFSNWLTQENISELSKVTISKNSFYEIKELTREQKEEFEYRYIKMGKAKKEGLNYLINGIYWDFIKKK